MNENALAVYQPTTLKEFIEVGNIFATSGYFKDATAGAQAIVKIMAGREIGLGLFESMNGFHIIEGKMTMAANLIATLVKRTPGYDYRVLELSREACRIEFYRDGEVLGASEFTIEDAKAANLVKPNSAWVKWPQNMLFARAISNGTRFYCPEVTGGMPIYTPDELGQEVDETGAAVSAPKIVTAEGEYVPSEMGEHGEQKPAHWIDTNGSRAKFWAWAKGDMSLTEAQVYEALGVAHIHDFTGSKKEAMERIKAYADKLRAHDPEEAEREQSELDEWFTGLDTLIAAMQQNSLLCPAGSEQEALRLLNMARKRGVEIDRHNVGSAINALILMVSNDADREADEHGDGYYRIWQEKSSAGAPTDAEFSEQLLTWGFSADD